MKINKDLRVETDLPKKIDEFKEPIAFGFSERHFMILVIDLFIAGLTYYLFYDFREVISWLILIPVVIVTLLGLVKINGMHIERLLPKLLKYKKGEKVKLKKIKTLQNNKNNHSIVVKIGDINYLVQDEDEREILYANYAETINSIDENIKFKFMLENRSYTEDDLKSILIDGNRVDEKNLKYASELNKIMKSKTVDSDNKYKAMYMYLTIENMSVDKAGYKLNQVVTALKRNFSDIRVGSSEGSSLRVLSDAEANELLERQFNFDLDSEMKFYKKHFEAEGEFYQIFAISDYGLDLNDNLLAELFTIQEKFNILLSVDNPKKHEFRKLLKRQKTQLESRIYNWQKKKEAKDGFSPLTDEAPLELRRELDAVLEVEDKIYEQNQRVFNLNTLILIKAETIEKLDEVRHEFDTVITNYQLETSTLVYQQKEALQMFLVNNFDCVHLKRFMLTENLANIVPFGVKNVSTNGEYMGLNKVSGEILSLDRKKLKNANGFIIGKSGSGKSVQAKLSILQTLLNNPDDDVIIIDPEREYRSLVEELGGETIELSSKSENYINPLHISKKMCKGTYPAKVKSEMVLSFVQNILFRELTAVEKSLIDRALRTVYFVWEETGEIPTLVELSKELSLYQEKEAKELVVAIELYTKGALDIFAKQSNIDYKNRLICFDTNELGSQLKSVGSMLILEEIWRKIVENKGKRITHIIIDEIHLLFREKSSIDFLLSIYKRVRKYGGVPTGITQDVEDLLKSAEARAMLANSEYIAMLAQSEEAQSKIQPMFDLSDELMRFINNPERGTGLIKYGADFIPFDNVTSVESEVFKLINTNNYASERE